LFSLLDDIRVIFFAKLEIDLGATRKPGPWTLNIFEFGMINFFDIPDAVAAGVTVGAALGTALVTALGTALGTGGREGGVTGIFILSLLVKRWIWCMHAK